MLDYSLLLFYLKYNYTWRPVSAKTCRKFNITITPSHNESRNGHEPPFDTDLKHKS